MIDKQKVLDEIVRFSTHEGAGSVCSQLYANIHSMSEEGESMRDLIDRQDAIKAIEDLPNCYNGFSDTYDKAYIIGVIDELPSAQPLTDIEQRIFLKAISREEEVCRKVDAEWGEGEEECEINLVHACHEIERKVKGALWT